MSGPPIPVDHIQPSDYAALQFVAPDDGRRELSDAERQAAERARFWPEADIKATISDDDFRWCAERGLFGQQLIRTKDNNWNPFRSAQHPIEVGRDRATVVAAFAMIHALAARLPRR